MDTKYHVYVRSMDGRHKITKRAVSFEKAKAVANDWLGRIADWTSSFRAISMFGDVVTIEEKE